jgi:hypothetical protein
MVSVCLPVCVPMSLPMCLPGHVVGVCALAVFSLPLWPCTVVTPISPPRHTHRHMHCFVMVLAVCVVPTEPREEAPVCVHSPAADHGDVGQGGLGSRKSFHNRPHQLHSPAAMLTTPASLPVAVNSVLDEGFIPVVPCTMAHRGCVYGAVFMSFGGDTSFSLSDAAHIRMCLSSWVLRLPPPLCCPSLPWLARSPSWWRRCSTSPPP